MSDIRLSELIAPSFHELHKDIKAELNTEYWLKGGRGSTKSTEISVEIVLGIIKDPLANAVVFRRYQNELRDTVYGQLEWTISKMGLDAYFKCQVSPMQITYLPTKQKILFKGADQPKKIKSVKLGKGYVKYLWFEEVDQYASVEEIRNIKQSYFRGGNEKRIAFYSFNPPKSGRAWVNKEVKIPKPGRLVHHSDYLSVPREWLGDIFIQEAEHLKNVNLTAYEHEYLGKEVGTGGEIFNNITVRAITVEERKAFDQIRQGIDWGYAVDPFCFERMHYDKTRRRLYFLNEIQGIGMSNRVAAENIKKCKYTDVEIIADSAEPKSIAEMKSEHGITRIKGAKKGPGSVEHGIKWLTDLEEIIIDPITCPLAANEFVNYSLERDRNGDLISKYPDKDNHSIDTARYGLEPDMKRKSGWR